MYPDLRQGTKTIHFKDREAFLDFVDKHEDNTLIHDVGYSEMVLLVDLAFKAPENTEEEIH